jgi:hypothetical protein
MQIDLEQAIRDARAAVEQFSRTLQDDEAVCIATRNLALTAELVAGLYTPIWTEGQSEAVESVFESARLAHEAYRRKHAKVSPYAERLEKRFKRLKRIFVHGSYRGVPTTADVES